jgi:hypothetical protein
MWVHLAELHDILEQGLLYVDLSALKSYQLRYALRRTNSSPPTSVCRRSDSQFIYTLHFLLYNLERLCIRPWSLD